HVGERSVGHAFAVRQAAAAVPVDGVGEPVEVLVELPREPRLPDPGDPEDRDEMGGLLVCGSVEEILDEAQLPVAPDERRLETRRLERTATAGCDAERAEKLRGLLLAFQLM